jgi:hypothetical protein
MYACFWVDVRIQTVDLWRSVVALDPSHDCNTRRLFEGLRKSAQHLAYGMRKVLNEPFYRPVLYQMWPTYTGIPEGCGWSLSGTTMSPVDIK